MFRERLKEFQVGVVALLLVAIVNWTISLGFTVLEGRSRTGDQHAERDRAGDEVRVIDWADLSKGQILLQLFTDLLKPSVTVIDLILTAFRGHDSERRMGRPTLTCPPG